MKFLNRTPPPEFPSRYRSHDIVRTVFVSESERRTHIGGVAVVTLRHLTK